MGKNHSKKSKLKLSSMWAQNSASGGMKEASLCDKDTGAEKRGLACLSRADLQSGQSLGTILQEEPKGLKVALRPPQVATSERRDSGARRGSAKGRGRPEGGHPDKNALLQPEKLPVLGQAADPPKDLVETEAHWVQHIRGSAKEYLDNEESESLPSAKKQAAAVTHGTESSQITEEALAGPTSPNERSTSRPPPSSSTVVPGGKKALLSWGAGQKEQTGQQDSAPGSDGDSKGLALAPQPPVELAKASSSPIEMAQASRNEVKTGEKNEDLGAEAVSSETMQELLEKGINFLYKVTVQPGQWPHSIKAVKQKPSVISSGISYADVLKQCPQRKSPTSAPDMPKALHPLTTASKKLPSFKGLERGNPEDLSPLSQLFLEHFKKVPPAKESAASHAPSQPVVTFFDELSPSNAKQTEWQRPRPPTPYPQRRKAQGRKLPKFGTAVSQVVAFLGSDPKCDWFVHDESQASSEEATVAVEEGGKDHADPAGEGNKGTEEAPSSSLSVASLSLAREMATEVDATPQRLRRRPQGMEEGAKETTPVKIAPYSTSWSVSCSLTPTESLQKEEQIVVPLLSPVPHSPREMTEVPSPVVSTPLCGPVGLIPDQKAPATAQARPKTRKQGPAAPKSKEKLKPPGQPKVKAPKETPLYLEKPDSTDQDETLTQGSPEQDREADPSPVHHWPAFQVANSCSMRCYCKHRDQRKLPKNVMAWLNPSTNHLAEPPWVATAMLAVSLVAGTKFCLDSYDQQHVTNED
ncbi:gametogenetin isoform X2 [Sceloporus undulatus]|uniref:gametogenetin isoform X2 n=1 Tax=Sceloporus undulatus TaxID=8520 RepID=UPI001C4C76BE|nr:gametogenetin isoform X2 [Sceloporus undulatus]